MGMGATLLDGVVVEKHAMVAAGALVRQNTRIPTGQVKICSLSISRPVFFGSSYFNFQIVMPEPYRTC